MDNINDLPTEPGILTEAERQAQHEADIRTRISKLEREHFRWGDDANPDRAWLCNVATAALDKSVEQRRKLAQYEAGQGIQTEIGKFVFAELQLRVRWHHVRGNPYLIDDL